MTGGLDYGSYQSVNPVRSLARAESCACPRKWSLLGRRRRRPMAAGSMRNAALAQLVEHIIRNDGVVGSSPSSGTTLSRTAAKAD